MVIRQAGVRGHVGEPRGCTVAMACASTAWRVATGCALCISAADRRRANVIGIVVRATERSSEHARQPVGRIVLDRGGEFVPAAVQTQLVADAELGQSCISQLGLFDRQRVVVAAVHD